MKIFVAGGTGVIGRRAVVRFVQAGHEVSVITRSDAKAADVVAAGASPVRVSLFDADALAAAVAGHDVVASLATHIPPLSKAARASAWEENDRIRTEGVRNLVDAALATKTNRFIQESLAFQYTDHGDQWIDEDGAWLDSPYGPAVLAAEDSVARFTAAGRTGVVLRFGQFYAAEAVHTVSMLKIARRGWSPMAGAGDAYLASIAADDAAAAVVAALDAPAGIFNIVDDDPLTRDEWAEVTARALGRKKLRPMMKVASNMATKRAPNLATSQRVSNARFKRATGWRPQLPSWREGIATLVPGADAAPGPASASASAAGSVAGA